LAPFVGVDVGEWNDLVARGREAGAVHAEELTHVLRHVELTGDVLAEVQSTMAGHGIAIDIDVEPVADDTPSGLGRTLVISDGSAGDDDEQLLSRRRQRRTRKVGPKGDGGTSDAVRMYLREIGQVDLLTVEHERRLAQLIEEGKIAAARIDAAGEAGEELAPGEDRLLMRAVSRVSARRAS